MLHVGWLRDLMQLSQPPMPSFGRLAETCLEHSEWPSDLVIQPRSLATLFSKLDREIDLDWLRERPAVQRVVCHALSRPVSDLRVALGEGPTLVHGRRLRLSEVRFARELDLVRELLPPGIPERAQNPGAWGHAYWVAPPGAGKSLVGAWLAARSLAEVVCIRSTADWENLPSSGALFVEVGSGGGHPPEGYRALLHRTWPVCIAGGEPDVPEGFDAFHSPPVSSYLSALASWTSARLDGSGHFAPERALAWMQQVVLPFLPQIGFGEVLGLFGALDELTPRSLRDKTLDDVASAFVERKLAEALVETSWGASPRMHAFEALGEAAARCLVERGRGLDGARTLDAWAELLAVSQDAPDEEWVVRAMRLADDGGSAPLRAAAKRLPPSGYRLARSLALGRLLVPRDPGPARADDELVLEPRWLVRVLERRSHVTALALAPSEWGAALLDESKRGGLEAALHAELLLGRFEAIETLLDQLDPAEPAHLAALDASLRQLGDVSLSGESIPDDLAADLATAITDTLVLIGDELVPTLGLAGPGAHRAALAALSRNHPLRERNLDPHRTEHHTLRSTIAADCVAISASKSGRLALEWLRLARELLEPGQPVPRVLALALTLLQSSDAASSSDWSDASDRELTLALSFASREGGDTTLEAAWNLLPPHRLPGISGTELLQKLWRRIPVHLPPELHASGISVAFELLLPHHYVAWLASSRRLPLEAAVHCPLEAAVEAAAQRGPACFESAALGVLLLRSPRLTRVLVERLKQDSHAGDASELACLPESALSTLVESFPNEQELLLWSRPAIDRVRLLLVTCVQKLGPRVEVAVFRLRALEMALGPLRRLSSPPVAPHSGP